MGPSKTEGKYSLEDYQMTFEGWARIAWNWKDGENNEFNALGCNTANSKLEDAGKACWSRIISGLPNMKDVIVGGQQTGSKPSLYVDKQVHTKDFEGYKSDFSKVFKLYMVSAKKYDFSKKGLPLKTYKNGSSNGDKKQKGRKSYDTQPSY